MQLSHPFIQKLWLLALCIVLWTRIASTAPSTTTSLVGPQSLEESAKQQQQQHSKPHHEKQQHKQQANDTDKPFSPWAQRTLRFIWIEELAPPNFRGKDILWTVSYQTIHAPWGGYQTYGELHNNHGYNESFKFGNAHLSKQSTDYVDIVRGQIEGFFRVFFPGGEQLHVGLVWTEQFYTTGSFVDLDKGVDVTAIYYAADARPIHLRRDIHYILKYTDGPRQ